MRKGILDLDDAILAFSVATRMVADNEMKIDERRVLELAESSGCTAYDCEFVSLAERLGVPLVTTDSKILTAFPSIAVSIDHFIEI